MSEVPRTPTPLSRAEMAAMLVPAYVDMFGEEPDRNRAELLLALALLENANGSAIIQHNWGNVSVFPSDGVSYWRPPWYDLAAVEQLPEGPKKQRLLDVHQRMVEHKAPQAFLALPSHAVGLQRWLGELKRRPSVLAAASAGDATRFAHEIFSTRYCPDPECRDAGPSYAKLRDQVAAAELFAGLKKKVSGEAAADSRLSSSWPPSPRPLLCGSDAGPAEEGRSS